MVDAPEGSLAVLRCFVEGDPKPIVTWSRDSEKVRITERKAIRVKQDRYIAPLCGLFIK